MILLLGGRFDIANQDFEDAAAGTDDFSQDEAFSPRVGIVYQPIEPISLYASFTRSFQQADNVFSTALVEPERGTQFEIGVKGDISDRLSATLAFYDLTLTNVSTTDPDNSLLTVPTGEQRSQGIELDVSGEILPGWSVIAGYAYTDAEVTEDNTFEVGNGLANIPENAFNFSTTYRIQQGSLTGLGFGMDCLLSAIDQEIWLILLSCLVIPASMQLFLTNGRGYGQQLTLEICLTTNILSRLKVLTAFFPLTLSPSLVLCLIILIKKLLASWRSCYNEENPATRCTAFS